MASRTPESLQRLMAELERLPGIGPRSAARIAHHLLRIPEADAQELATAIQDVRAKIRPCSACHAPAETDPCGVCDDHTRERSLLMVVETPRDLNAVEIAGSYRGLYFVLGGRLSPLEGMARDGLDLDQLIERASDDEVSEVCIATNPDLEGDGTALAVRDALLSAPKLKNVRITRIARGVPTGGQIEYQNASVLADAFEGRRDVS